MLQNIRGSALKMKPKIYDLTPKISNRLAVFPGDQPFQRNVLMSFATGQHLDLSTVLTTVHLGAHADAPSHYHSRGETMEKRSLGRYMGSAQVIRITGLGPKQRVMPEHLTVPIRAPRVLIDTMSFMQPEQWTDDFNAFSPELLTKLADQGVQLVGIDTPSVDPADSKALESHQVLFQRDLGVLEGLVLVGVPEGLYTLIALPLPIEGGDASPVRAVLLPQIQDFPDLS
jgi:arylformamidase